MTTDKPWLEADGSITSDPEERAKEFIRRLEARAGMTVPVNCPVCGHAFGWGVDRDSYKGLQAAFGTVARMPLLLVRCQYCPFIFTFDVGRNGFGDMPERPEPPTEKDVTDVPNKRKARDLRKRLDTSLLSTSKHATDAVQLLHIMIRSVAWAPYERPENYPVWRPEDPIYHFSQFFGKAVDEERMAIAFLCLQKDGLVRKSGEQGFVLAEVEEDD